MRAEWLAVAVLSTAPGCASPGAYWKSRALDLWDVVPTAVEVGKGLAVSARATPFFQTGLGLYGAYADPPNAW